MGRGGAAECCAQEMEISESTGTSVKCGIKRKGKERGGKNDQGETRKDMVCDGEARRKALVWRYSRGLFIFSPIH